MALATTTSESNRVGSPGQRSVPAIATRLESGNLDDLLAIQRRRRSNNWVRRSPQRAERLFTLAAPPKQYPPLSQRRRDKLYPSPRSRIRLESK